MGGSGNDTLRSYQGNNTAIAGGPEVRDLRRDGQRLAVWQYQCDGTSTPRSWAALDLRITDFSAATRAGRARHAVGRLRRLGNEIDQCHRKATTRSRPASATPRFTAARATIRFVSGNPNGSDDFATSLVAGSGNQELIAGRFSNSHDTSGGGLRQRHDEYFAGQQLDCWRQRKRHGQFQLRRDVERHRKRPAAAMCWSMSRPTRHSRGASCDQPAAARRL